MRHIMGVRSDRDSIEPSAVDTGIGHHEYRW